ncbi:MAG: RNA 2',3'-cyclic phosphodiesterase [Bryobacteraceae bacterium]
MRLFTGIDIPDDLAAPIGKLVAQWKPLAAIRWSKIENLHVTTKFIGEWPEERLDEMKQSLAAIEPREPFPISFRGLGWFPNPHRPRLFWIAVHGGAALAGLAREIEERLATIGVAQEDREFRPHLTLARVEPRGGGPTPDLGAVRRAIAQLDSDEFGSFIAHAFHLYLSEPGSGGSKYTKLATFPMRGAA